MAMKVQGGRMVPAESKQVTMREAQSIGRAHNFVRIADKAINEAAAVFAEGAKYVPASALNEYQQAARTYVNVMQESAKAKKMLEDVMRKLDAAR